MTNSLFFSERKKPKLLFKKSSTMRGETKDSLPCGTNLNLKNKSFQLGSFILV